jgi:hypothetical protein
MRESRSNAVKQRMGVWKPFLACALRYDQIARSDRRHVHDSGAPALLSRSRGSFTCDLAGHFTLPTHAIDLDL